MRNDFDVSKIGIGWRVQFDATSYNAPCKELHGTWGAVTGVFGQMVEVLDDLKNMRRQLDSHRADIFLDALPPGLKKDPFAVGEWVVCVKYDCPKNVGEIVRVEKEHWNNPNYWFAVSVGKGNAVGMRKSHFRPATPEEIAAHLEKKDMAKNPITAEDVDLKITPKFSCGEECSPASNEGQTKEKITFTVSGREFFVGQTVYATSGVLDLCSRGDCLMICGRFPNSDYLSVRKPGYHIIFSIHPNSVSGSPPHNWQFGDQASHPGYGKVLVIDMTAPESFQCASPSNPDIYIDPSELTFIRRTDLGE